MCDEMVKGDGMMMGWWVTVTRIQTEDRVGRVQPQPEEKTGKEVEAMWVLDDEDGERVCEGVGHSSSVLVVETSGSGSGSWERVRVRVPREDSVQLDHKKVSRQN